jgi:hypothetical protein
MARRIRKTIEMIGYILTPEFSAEPDLHLRGAANRTLAPRDLRGYVKSVAWIFAAIMLALAVGQLN